MRGGAYLGDLSGRGGRYANTRGLKAFKLSKCVKRHEPVGGKIAPIPRQGWQAPTPTPEGFIRRIQNRANILILAKTARMSHQALIRRGYRATRRRAAAKCRLRRRSRVQIGAVCPAGGWKRAKTFRRSQGFLRGHRKSVGALAWPQAKIVQLV